VSESFENVRLKGIFAVLPVKVELVKIRTIFELTGGKFSKEPANIKSMVLSSILKRYTANLVKFEVALSCVQLLKPLKFPETNRSIANFILLQFSMR